MRALVLSDIHGNLEALNAVLAAAGEYDAMWNLGDVVGYGASPNEVVAIMREKAQMNVRGNHDRVCCGLASAVGFNPIARAAADWTREELTDENREWLAATPKGPLTPEGMPSISLAHGSPLNEDQYIITMRDAWAPLQQEGVTTTFIGHTHLQGGFLQKDQDWHELRPRYETKNDAESWTLDLPEGTHHLINPGSIGQPRDNDWRAAFAIFDTEAQQIVFHRVPYDLTAAQGRILMAGLPEKLASRLREGR
ncbi:MAG: metallophosphoesterase family protein [Edaphobacter sp.]|uniref:metallophosphoesterase family protein n=1 Tax=Edaphobacter sp. TaxID=1934404 RepID=UPI0023995DAE|nr:metallophosphoesterase family protein [Edaphobacter sp.]MDE1178560.1 metallophosphoesterase family protein [Edaphobacter sp.]